ncbi:hypothetical protein ABT294_02465 [Nonomuraea sp. NPDC000554]|uniref:hypothetical protein n=1 Tax=Nonomuraea sp. NPDC000554 TaxID=3154259 RepID=UPI00331AEDB8
MRQLVYPAGHHEAAWRYRGAEPHRVLDEHPVHAERYAGAHGFLEVVTALWDDLPRPASQYA